MTEKEKAIAFADWIAKEYYVYDHRQDKWYEQGSYGSDYFTTDQLFEKYKKSIS